jgi:hypothetical protein
MNKLCLVLAAISAAGVEVAAQPPKPARLSAPFVQVVRAERIRLAEPVTFKIAGRPRQVTDVWLLVLRPANRARFLPRDREYEHLMLGDFETAELVPPVLGPLMAVMAPAQGPLEQMDLWTALGHHAVQSVPQEQLAALRQQARRIGNPQRIALDKAAAEKRIREDVQPVADLTALRRYSLGLVRKLEGGL